MFDSPVSIIDRSLAETVDGSFEAPIADPGTLPTDAPLWCIHVNKDWVPVLVGCALQAVMGATWGTADTAGIDTLVYHGHLLLLQVAKAQPCAMGSVSITILAGNADATASVTFSAAFDSAPIVVVSSDNPDWIASFSSVTTTGFTAIVTADVPVLTNTTATFTYHAGIAS